MAIPGIGGICIWSPPLDKKGNSVKGLTFAKELIKKYPQFHINYDSNFVRNSKIHVADLHEELLVQVMIDAAAKGNIDIVKQVLSTGKIEVNDTDYDLRTALHLAVAEGHYNIIVYLLENGANVMAKDRVGTTALHEAKYKITEDENNEYNKIYNHLNKFYNTTKQKVSDNPSTTEN